MRAGRGRESGRGVTLRTPGSATKDLGPRYRCGRTRQTGVTLNGRHEADATASCRTLASVVGAARDHYQPRMSTDHRRPNPSAPAGRPGRSRGPRAYPGPVGGDLT